jgi:tRNA(Ile)-lysidine synthase TilS/MesJ
MFAQSKSHASGFAIIEFHNSILNFNLYFFMLDKLKSHIAQNFPLENKKLFLATSGGLDSIVMAHLFKQLN